MVQLFGSRFLVFDHNDTTREHLTSFGWLLAGLLIGLGSKMAGGLTGGHAYCSAPVLHKGSLIAMLTSIISGMVVATTRYNYPFLVPDFIDPHSGFVAFFYWISIFVFAFISLYSIGSFI
jgi:uncharacterized membrane protein YedE/YeeE